jgi:hypothetical protein
MTRATSTSKAWRWVEEIIEPGLSAMMRSARCRPAPPLLRYRRRRWDDDRNKGEPRLHGPQVSFFVAWGALTATTRSVNSVGEAVIDRWAPTNVASNLPPRTLTFRWRDDSDDTREAEEAEIERLRDEGKTVVSIGWEKPPEDDGKLIEGQGPQTTVFIASASLKSRV